MSLTVSAISKKKSGWVLKVTKRASASDNDSLARKKQKRIVDQ